MRVYVGSDHAGFELKNHLITALRGLRHDVVDVGPQHYDPEDDYPSYCLATAARVVATPGSLGVVVGGSGNGEQIAANDVAGVRAALSWSDETARLARQHNDANVVSIGARMHAESEAKRFVDVFLSTAYSGDERHSRRLAMLTDYETDGRLPPLPGQR